MTEPAASLTVTPVSLPEKTDRFLTRIPLHPLLFAVWPVLRLYGDNVKEFSLVELLLPMLIAVGLATVALLLLTLVWREPRRAAIVASLNAWHLPGPEGLAPVLDDVSLVNTYPEILPRYFEVDPPRAEDRIFATTVPARQIPSSR